MTKTEMQTDVKEMFNKYAFLFRVANITDVAFFTWFDKHKTHEDLMRAHRFVMGQGQGTYTDRSLVKQVLIANEYYKNATSTEWENLYVAHPRHTQVVLLKKLCKGISELWLKRPRAPRGGG